MPDTDRRRSTPVDRDHAASDPEPDASADPNVEATAVLTDRDDRLGAAARVAIALATDDRPPVADLEQLGLPVRVNVDHDTPARDARCHALAESTGRRCRRLAMGAGRVGYCEMHVDQAPARGGTDTTNQQSTTQITGKANENATADADADSMASDEAGDSRESD